MYHNPLRNHALMVQCLSSIFGTTDSPYRSAKQEWIQAKYELGLFKQANQVDEEEEGPKTKVKKFKYPFKL